MANKMYEETYIQDIADAIRERNGNATDTYRVSEMGSAVRNIPSGDGCDHQIKVYTGTISETISDSGAYAVLAKDSFLAEHRNDENLFVRVEFDIEPTAYTIRKSWGTNTVHLMVSDTNTYKQLFQRYGSDGSVNHNNSTYGVNDNTSPTGGVGRLFITEEGELWIYSNSSNYAIRPSNYTVKVEW